MTSIYERDVKICVKTRVSKRFRIGDDNLVIRQRKRLCLESYGGGCFEAWESFINITWVHLYACACANVCVGVCVRSFGVKREC